MELIGIQILILAILEIMALISKKFGLEAKSLWWALSITFLFFTILDLILVLNGIQLS